MGAMMATVGGWLLGSALARVLTGAGLTLITATWLSTQVTDALNSVAAQWSGLPADGLAFLAYSGIGTYLSIIGSALVARAAIVAAAGVLGIGKS